MRILKYFGERFVVNVVVKGNPILPIQMGYGETVLHLKQKIGAHVLTLMTDQKRVMTDDELVTNRASTYYCSFFHGETLQRLGDLDDVPDR